MYLFERRKWIVINHCSFFFKIWESLHFTLLGKTKLPTKGASASRPFSDGKSEPGRSEPFSMWPPSETRMSEDEAPAPTPGHLGNHCKRTGNWSLAGAHTRIVRRTLWKSIQTWLLDRSPGVDKLQSKRHDWYGAWSQRASAQRTPGQWTCLGPTGDCSGEK